MQKHVSYQLFLHKHQIHHHVLALKSSILLYDALPAVARNAGKSAVYMLASAPEWKNHRNCVGTVIATTLQKMCLTLTAA